MHNTRIESKGVTMPNKTAGHTPSPWKACQDVHGHDFWHVEGGLPGQSIAMVHAVNAEANARLIAACPKMYDYVTMRAKEGDKDAQEILRDLSA